MTGSMIETPCHCMTIRQSARRLTQLYDRHLTPSGLTSSQYGVLRKLGRIGPISINALADSMVMDRTTLRRTLRPLERNGFVAIGPGPDGRTRAISLSDAGRARITVAKPLWERAQAEFETAYGAEEAESLRRSLSRVVTTTDAQA